MHVKKYALVCLPADTLDKGLRMEDLGKVDIPKAKEQHRAYCRMLENLGFILIEMPKDDRYPDSVFVEDPAVIIRDILIITQLRRKERQGEERKLKEVLSPFFSNVFHIEEPGFIEGGDVLVADSKLYVGLSSRTNIEGAEQLEKIARDNLGMPTDIFRIPKHFLHLKGGASFHKRKNAISKNIITISQELFPYFSDCDDQVIITPFGERFGANGISADNQMIIHAGRIKTKSMLEKVGFQIHELEMSEFEKIDGALSCLSKLFSVNK